MFKVNNESLCSTCGQKVNSQQCLKCVECDGLYHAICASAGSKESQLCNSSFLKAFLTPSVKDNFTWTCDICKTEAESDKVATLRQTMSAMSKSHSTQIAALTSSIEILSDRVNAIALNFKPDEVKPTVWSDATRVQKVKSALVVKPDERGNTVNSKDVRKIAADEGIPVDSVIESGNGEMFVNLPDEESRDRVTQLLVQSHSDNPVVKLKSKLPSIAVHGVTSRDVKNGDDEDLSKEELAQCIYRQNGSIAALMDKGSHLSVVYVRSPPARKVFYTVVLRVSPDIRTLIKKMKNKIHLGVSVHNIVDRFHVRRCNRCQELGHYEDKCDPNNHVVCGFCAKDHKSDVCPDKNAHHSHHKCINCSGEGIDASGHSAFWPKCPAYVTAQKKMMKTIAYDYELN